MKGTVIKVLLNLGFAEGYYSVFHPQRFCCRSLYHRYETSQVISKSLGFTQIILEL